MNTNSLSRRIVVLALGLSATLTAFTPHVAHAFDENSTDATNVDSKGVALHGFDPVSYFSEPAPKKGDKALSAVHEGFTYLFSSKANRDKFAADPGRYAPQFGGFCAMGVAMGKKFDVDPGAYKVVDGRLYLNLNKDVQKRWLDDVPGNIKTAEQSWPSLRKLPPKGL